MKKKRLTVIAMTAILLILGLIYGSSAKAEYVYRSEEGHFSFLLPDDWIGYPKDAMDEMNKQIMQFTKQQWKYNLGFHKGDTDFPHFYIVIDKRGKKSEGQIQIYLKEQTSQAATQMTLNKINSSSLFGIHGVKVGEYSYDAEHKILYMPSRSTRENFGNIIGNSIFMFTNYGMLNIHFYSLEGDFNKDLDDFNKILESFKIDEGYRY